jgi:hypothetical protein
LLRFAAEFHILNLSLDNGMSWLSQATSKMFTLFSSHGNSINTTTKTSKCWYVTFMSVHISWRNRKHVCVLCAVIMHAGICQNMKCWEARHEAECFSTLCNSTQDEFSISFIKYESLRSFVHAMGSCTACATANQIV